jgi:hypothetical protein
VLIRELFQLKSQTGEIGLEIEVEGTNLPHIHNEVWKTVGDNSLKGGKEGQEYVMFKPTNLENLPTILDEFKDRFFYSDVDDSVYAGIHVHINVQNMTPKQLITYLVSFFILEELLVKWCGTTRTGNHFCLRSSDAEYLVHYIRKLILDDKLVADKDTIRYSAANIESLLKYGSVEFRCLNSTIEPERILTWCRVLSRIKKESLTYSSPDEVVKSLQLAGPTYFVTKMLGDDAKNFLTFDWEESIYDGLSRAQDIAFCRDWANKDSYNIFKRTKGIYNE